MRSTPLARYLAAFLALTPAAAIADPPVKGAAAPAPAPKPAPKAAAPAPAKQNARPAGKAAGGAATKPKGAAGKKKKGPQDEKVTGPVATYPGFRMLDGGASRVFVTLSKKVNVTEHKAEGKLTYRIQGVHVPTSTNRLPLLTSFFATPVSRAELVNREGDVDLVIDVKGGATPQFRVLETDKGAELQVDFPKLATAETDDGSGRSADTSAGRPSTTKSLESPPGSAY